MGLKHERHFARLLLCQTAVCTNYYVLIFIFFSFITISGAVKITPGHDHVDFEVGQRHGLEIMDILNDDGTLKEDTLLIGGMSRFQARKKLREALCQLGLYHGEMAHATVLPLCR